MRFSRNALFLLLAGCGLGLGVWMLWHPLGVPVLRGSQAKSAEEAIPPVPPDPVDGELYFPKTTVDLGLVTKETVCKFSFENRGQGVIKILEVRPSCNCTMTKPEKQTLLPGERSRIVVTVSPRLQRIGRNLYIVNVDYQGQGGPRRQTRLSVLAQHRPDVVVPERISLRVIRGRPNSARFSLIDYREQPLTIKEIKTSSPSLHARVTEEPSSYLPGWQYRLEVSLSPELLLSGNREESVLLQTTDPQRETISVRVALQQARRIRAVPAPLRLKAVEGQPGKQKGSLFIDDTEGEPLEIRSATSSHPGLKCTPRRGPERGGVLLEAELDESRLKSLHDPLSIRIMVTKPIREELCITVLARSSSSPRSP